MSLDGNMPLSDSLQVVEKTDENEQCVYYFKVLRDYYDNNIKNSDSSCFIELSLDETGDYYIISLEDMKACLKDMYKVIEGSFFFRFSTKMFDLRDKCFVKLNDLYQKLEFLNDSNNGNSIACLNSKDIMNFIEYNSFISDVSDRFWYFEELCFEKANLLHSLKYFCSVEELQSFDDEYSNASVDCDVPKLELLLKNAQSMILEHWIGATTNISDYKSGMPFRFLCHSVRSPQFHGTFHTKYVSASLLTEKLMYTLNESYGFILDTSSIVVASDEDIGVYNKAKNIEGLYYNSPILPVQGLEEILENCYKRIEKQGNSYEIYSEIVTEGFNPIGIFAITDGSKEINPNYDGAYQLKKQFPNLPVVEIDKTLYYDDEKNKHIFIHNLISNILSYKEAKGIKVVLHSSLPIDYYDDFWQEFMELKKSDNYIAEEIVELFDKHESLLFEVDVENLFEKYNESELTKILNYSDYLGTNELVFSKFYYVSGFNKVYNRLKKYVGDTRLDKYVPGLSRFLILMERHLNLTKKDWYEISGAVDLEQVNMILARVLGMNSSVESEEHMLDSDSPMDSSDQNKLVLKIG